MNADGLSSDVASSAAAPVSPAPAPPRLSTRGFFAVAIVFAVLVSLAVLVSGIVDGPSGEGFPPTLGDVLSFLAAIVLTALAGMVLWERGLLRIRWGEAALLGLSVPTVFFALWSVWLFFARAEPGNAYAGSVISGMVPFILTSCGVTYIFCLIEIAASFPNRGLSVRRILFNPWATILAGFYVAVTLCASLILLENGSLKLTLAYALGLGFGVPWALQTGVTLFQPLVGKDKEIAVSLKEVTGRLRKHCYLKIKESLLGDIMATKTTFLKKTEDELIEILKSVCPDDEYQKIEPIIIERRAKAPATLKPLLLSFIEKYNPLYPKLQEEQT